MLSGYTYGVACCVFAPEQTKEHWTKNPLGSGEPYNYHILNRYFDEYFPRAIANAAAMKKMHSNSTTANDTYTYMTQAWVVALYLDCNSSGVSAWPGSGSPPGANLLHCPNATSVAALEAALRDGTIFVHGCVDGMCVLRGGDVCACFIIQNPVAHSSLLYECYTCYITEILLNDIVLHYTCY